MIAEVAAAYPNFQVIATTLRRGTDARSATTGARWPRRRHFRQATPRRDLDILDRVGGGDSFASGLVYGLLSGQDLLDGPSSTAPPTARWP